MEKNYISNLVSIVIPTYKRADSLTKAIDSVLNQTYKNIELIVVNDNISGDEYSKTLYKIIECYSDKRLNLVEQEKHINGAAARNAGIMVAKGEFIAFLDDDDYWEPEKIERQVKLIKKLGKNWGAVSCLMRIYSHGKLISSALPYRDGSILLDILDRRTSMGTGALLIRRNALDKSGYFDESLKRHQDLQLFSRLASNYKIKLDCKYLHNREVSDTQNRQSPEELVKTKEKYYISIDDILRSLSPKKLKYVYIMHDFECAYAFYKAKKYKEGFLRTIGIFKYPFTFYLAVERSCRRIIETKFASVLEKKYKV